MEEDLAGWPAAFLAFHARFARHFFRAEVRERSRAYLQALLDHVERKNGWQLAEAMGEVDPNGAQRPLYEARWDADAVRDALQRFVTEAFGQPDGVLIVDESGVPKKGEQSVGVAKQYCGALGKVERCQEANVPETVAFATKPELASEPLGARLGRCATNQHRSSTSRLPIRRC